MNLFNKLPGFERSAPGLRLQVRVGQTDMRHRPLTMVSLGDALAMDQLEVPVTRIGAGARIKARHLAALAFQNLEEDALPRAEHAGDVVLRGPGMDLAPDRVGRRRARLRFDRFARVDQANRHGGEAEPTQDCRTVQRH